MSFAQARVWDRALAGIEYLGDYEASKSEGCWSYCVWPILGQKEFFNSEVLDDLNEFKKRADLFGGD